MGICQSTKDKNVKDNNNNKDNSKDQDQDKDKENSDKKLSKEQSKNESAKRSEAQNSKKMTIVSKQLTQIKTIVIKFIEKGIELFVEETSSSELISHLFELTNEKLNKYSNYDLLDSNGQSLNDFNDKIIYEVFPSITECEVQVLYMGLEISKDVRKEYELKTTIIGTPLLDLGDSVGIAMYHKPTKKVNHTLINDPNLLKFSYLSSYCNGNNTLFISGGEGQVPNEALTDFYAIDLLALGKVSKLPDLNIARSWHSMLFVPPRYVLIVGGTVKSVELYDLVKNSIIVDSELNEIRGESTLCCVNNAIIYCFCGFIVNESHLNTIEKCNLRKSKRQWEYVNYATSDTALFEQCFYACSYHGDKTLILFGTNENPKVKMQNILFDFEDEDNESIAVYEPDGNEGKICDVCPEKFFHPINDKSMILFPLTSSVVKLYLLEDLKLETKTYPSILNEILDY